jgi:hypothetical protein
MNSPEEHKVEVITHPDGSQTANGHPILTAFQADILKKQEDKRIHTYISDHHIGDIVYIQQTEFKITGVAFYANHVSYQLFGVINGTISMDWYTENFFTTTPGKKIWFETE